MTGAVRIIEGLIAYVSAANMALDEMTKEPNEREWIWCNIVSGIGHENVVDGALKLAVPIALTSVFLSSRL